MKKILRLLKYISLSLLLTVTVYAVFNYKLVQYGLTQLSGQLHIVMNTRPCDELLNDPVFPDSLKTKLRLINEIRRFAVDSLGLNDSKNYTTLYDQQGKPSLWVLTACKPYSMEAYEWKFPFLGAVSYKGFFQQEKGIEEKKQLQQEGYDTDLHPTGGWSTLGWFKDPILSNMLRRTEGQLAELIIHELSHATLFLPGSIDYNENFATFVGEQGAKQFLRHRYGQDSEVYRRYLEEQQDEALYGSYMVQATRRLDSLYRQLPDTMKTAEKSRKKTEFIASIILNINSLNLNRRENFPQYKSDMKLPNNCYFMTYKRYRNIQGDFQQEMDKSGGDLQAWITKLRESQ